MKESNHRGTNRVMHMARPHYSKCNSHSKPGKVPVEFRCDAPNAEKVYLAGDFNDWTQPLALHRNSEGLWLTEIKTPGAGRYQYKFIVDGKRWIEDPSNGMKTPDGYGALNSLLMIE